MSMERNVEGVHTGVLWKINGKRVRRLRDRSWHKHEAEDVREESGTQM